MSERTTSLETAEEFNAAHPIGTRVLAFPGSREGRAILTTTRSEAWRLSCGDPVVMVEGYAGGIALTHIEVMPDAQALEATDPTPGEIELDPDRPYASRTFAEVVDDYVLVRGDLSAEYARKQLVSEHEARLAAEAEKLRQARDEWRATAFGLEDEKEAAEAREAELRATVERVEVLADEWADFEHDAVVCPEYDCGDCTMLNAIHDLRAALTTPPTTEGGK